MSYIESHLGMDERVIQEAKVSKVALIPSVVIAILILIVMAALGGTGIIIGLIVAALIIAGKWFEMKEIELAVTNKKLAGKTGSIRKLETIPNIV